MRERVTTSRRVESSVAEAMLRYCQVALLILGFIAGTAQGGEYDDAQNACLLKYAARAGTAAAVREARSACSAMTTPKKCRSAGEDCKLDSWIVGARKANPGASDAELTKYWVLKYGEGKCPALEECKTACEKESVWSRRFGECSIDNF